MDFFSFEAALLRLKGALALQADKDVADALGMAASAFNKRKARGSFPEAEVRALAAERGFDAEYVISGVAQAALEMIQAAREGRPLKKVSANDAALLSAWHTCSESDQQLLFDLLMRLSQSAVAVTPSGVYPKAEEATAPTLHERRRKSL
ncbi:helix-turn-helix domain-containing protein [Hydrogenophaga sp. A37]|uniref:helix-turn-helix domain-containing protein n=1 Tax=Hydrogenophaga sp. A37 TaxID=1945864 RepID=UPI000985EDAB|nr:helix-turn-helix domain-containing protein [Hydrogenophaga sp. A37]OOG81531.1 hypothetical protein B0E41_17370 [Hydrogenophaga sp. A37]